MEKNKMQQTGEKIQKMGCAMTLLFTIPIVLTIFLGIPGLIIGGIVAIAGVVGMIKQKD